MLNGGYVPKVKIHICDTSLSTKLLVATGPNGVYLIVTLHKTDKIYIDATKKIVGIRIFFRLRVLVLQKVLKLRVELQ